MESGAFEVLQSTPRFHRCVANKKLTKEVTESWAIVESVRRILANANIGKESKEVCLLGIVGHCCRALQCACVPFLHEPCAFKYNLPFLPQHVLTKKEENLRVHHSFTAVP